MWWEYILYTGPLCEIISAHPDIQYAVYADNTQLYIAMSPNKHKESLQKLSQLKLNQSKTEILHITYQFRNYGDLPSLDLADVDVFPPRMFVTWVELLIISWTCNNTSEILVAQLLSASLKFVNRQSTERLIHDLLLHILIIVKAYYLVYLTLPLLRYNICRIQQPILSLNPGNMNITITPILNSLHWLPVVNRIKFKIL